MDSVKPYISEDKGYQEVVRVVDSVFFERTGRKIQEGNLIEQLRDIGTVEPRQLLEGIVNEIAERLEVNYPMKTPKTTEEMCDSLLQLLLAGIKTDYYSLVDM